MQTISKPSAIWAKLLELPPERQQQVLDFIEFLHSHTPRTSEHDELRDALFATSESVNYERLLETIEDEGIYRSMVAVKEETPLDLESALVEIEKH